MNPALRKGLILGVGLLIWTYGGMAYFDPHSPWTAWFNALGNVEKVKFVFWIFIAVMILSDAAFLLKHGMIADKAQGNRRKATSDRRSHTDRRKGMR
jgi:hypothetical protein